MYQNFDEESKSTQQVQTAVPQYAHKVQYGCKCACYVQCVGYASVNTVYDICSYVESNYVLVANDYTTYAVSPTRKAAPRKDV